MRSGRDPTGTREVDTARIPTPPLMNRPHRSIARGRAPRPPVRATWLARAALLAIGVTLAVPAAGAAQELDPAEIQAELEAALHAEMEAEMEGGGVVAPPPPAPVEVPAPAPDELSETAEPPPAPESIPEPPPAAPAPVNLNIEVRVL